MTTGNRVPGAADVARMLAADMPGLVAELLPAARRHGREAVVGSIHGEAGGSLSICLAGPRAGIWADFAAGTGGDALDLVAAVLFRGDKSAAWRWGLRRLGYTPPGEATGGNPPPPPPPPPGPAPARAAMDAEAMARRRQALALFIEAAPLTGTCPASRYLEARGIALAELGRIPRALRFHPRCWCSELRAPLPALVAAIIGADGEHLATHRVYLAEDAGTWRKAPLRDAKKALGSFAGGFIPLWRGASGKPLSAAEDGAAVVVAEGIETGLSVALVAPELRVLAAVSLSNLARLALPEAVRIVTIAADNDAPDSPAAAALARAVERFAAERREVRIARSPTGKDFNDAIAATAAEDTHP